MNNQGSPVTDGHYIAIGAYGFDPNLANTVFGPVLRPVVKSNTYKVPPSFLMLVQNRKMRMKVKSISVTIFFLEKAKVMRSLNTGSDQKLMVHGQK